MEELYSITAKGRAGHLLITKAGFTITEANELLNEVIGEEKARLRKEVEGLKAEWVEPPHKEQAVNNFWNAALDAVLEILSP